MLQGIYWLLMLGVGAHASYDPFWKSKAKIYDRVQAGEVMVSVSARDVSPQKPKWELNVNGGGHVRASCAVVFSEAQNYEETARLTGYVKNPKYDSTTGRMHITISAYTYAREVDLTVTANEGERRIEFRMLNGPMRDFWWALKMTDFKPQVCEIALTGGYKYDEFPIPRLFLEFGMEVVFKRMAERLRSHVLDKDKKS